MKTFNKVNFHRTAALSLSDKDDAKIFKTPNSAIHWIKSTGLVDKVMDVWDDGLFVVAFQSPTYTNKETGLEGYAVYSIFNFGVKAAIYVEEFEGDCVVTQRFMTRKEADQVHPEY